MAKVQTNLEKNMAEMFDLPVDPVIEEVKEVKPVTNKLDDDFDQSRAGLVDLLVIGKDALEHALAVAKQSDDPKAYAVIGDLISKLADINEQMLDLHLKQQRHKIIANPRQEQQPQLNTVQPNQPQQITNQTIFVGNGADLAKLIKQNMESQQNVITQE